MTRFRMDDGAVLDTNNARDSWAEAKDWDGRNNISRATGQQFHHETLYISRRGRYYVERYSDYQGVRPSAEWISKRAAAAWLLLNDHAIPDDLREVADEVAE